MSGKYSYPENSLRRVVFVAAAMAFPLHRLLSASSGRARRPQRGALLRGDEHAIKTADEQLTREILEFVKVGNSRLQARNPTLKAESEPSAAAPPSSKAAILDGMKVEDIAEAVARLPPDELARFRRWFTAFEAGRTDHAAELDSTATKLGRFAGRALAELKKRTGDRKP